MGMVSRIGPLTGQVFRNGVLAGAATSQVKEPDSRKGTGLRAGPLVASTFFQTRRPRVRPTVLDPPSLPAEGHEQVVGQVCIAAVADLRENGGMISGTVQRKSGSRCRIRAEVFVEGVRGRPRGVAPSGREPRS